ncbi:MAG: lysostaphin resistance A-like protein [Terriglobia bacterium]
MDYVSPFDELPPATKMRRATEAELGATVATACEIAAVFASILLYIWRWQRAHPLFWIPILAFIILTHVLHHDSPRALGLTQSGLKGSAEIILPIAAAVYTPVVLYGLASHRFVLAWPGKLGLERFAGYAVWCCFQQYLVQCYFHHRLMSVIRSPHLSSLIVAVMFGAAHIPNPVLMAATLIGGFILAEVYARSPNIWPLALAQAAGGLLIATLVPASIIHNMRVGPGYYTYRQH